MISFWRPILQSCIIRDSAVSLRGGTSRTYSFFWTLLDEHLRAILLDGAQKHDSLSTPVLPLEHPCIPRLRMVITSLIGMSYFMGWWAVLEHEPRTADITTPMQCSPSFAVNLALYMQGNHATPKQACWNHHVWCLKCHSKNRSLLFSRNHHLVKVKIKLQCLSVIDLSSRELFQPGEWLSRNLTWFSRDPNANHSLLFRWWSLFTVLGYNQDMSHWIPVLLCVSWAWLNFGTLGNGCLFVRRSKYLPKATSFCLCLLSCETLRFRTMNLS